MPLSLVLSVLATLGAFSNEELSDRYAAAAGRCLLAEMPSAQLLRFVNVGYNGVLAEDLLPLAEEKRTVKQALKIANSFEGISDRELGAMVNSIQRDIQQEIEREERERRHSDLDLKNRRRLQDECQKLSVLYDYLFKTPDDILNPWVFGDETDFRPLRVPAMQMNMGNVNPVEQYQLVRSKYHRRFASRSLLSARL